METSASIERLQRVFNIGIIILLIISGIKILSFYLWFDHQKQFKQAIEVRYKVHDIANAMRQNSDYLSRMARNYVITADTFAKHQFLATLAIRKKQSSHPHFYHIETSDTQYSAEPDIIKSQANNGVFIDQLASAGFTGDGKEIVEMVEYETDSLTLLMIEAYYAMEGRFKDENGQYTITGQPNQKLAIEILYGHAYNETKNRVTNKLNESFITLEANIEEEVNRLHKATLLLLYFIFVMFLVIAGMLVFLFVINTRLKKIIVYELNAKVEKRTRELQLINEQNIQLNEEMETQNEELTQLNEELIQTNEALYEQQKITEEAKDQFEHLFNVNPDAVMITRTSDGKIVQANYGSSELFGYPLELMIGKTTTELKMWGTSNGRSHFLQAMMEKGNLSDHEAKLCRKDGQKFDAVISTTMIEIAGLPHIISVIHDISARKQYEEALRQSEALYHDLVETSQDLIWQCDSEGRYTYLNAAWQDVFGYPINEMLGKKFSDFQTVDQQILDALEFDKLIQGKTVRGLETIHIGKTGNEIHLVFNAKPIIASDGTFIGTRGAAYDITKRKQVEKALSESKERFLQLFKNLNSNFALHEIIFDVDGKPYDYRFLEVNPAFEKATGFKASDLVGKTVLELFPETEAYWINKFAEVAISGIPVRYENYSKELDRYFEMNLYSPQRGQFAMIGSDITDRKLAENALQERNQFIESLINISPEILYIYDVLEQKNIFSNHRIEQILGYSTDEIREMGNQIMHLLMHPDDYASYLETILPLYSTVKDGEQIEVTYRLKSKSGSWVWIESVEIIYKRNADGTPLQIFGISRDVTENMHASETLKHQERFLRALTDNIPGMVGYWTKDLICGFANSAYLTWFGKTKTEMLGYELTELLGESLYYKNKPYIDGVLKGIPQDFERTLVNTNGEQGYMWAHYIPDFKDEEVVGFYVLISDITELKVAQLKIQKQNAELLEINSTKDKLFSIIAHDLRGPLGSLRMLNQILMENLSNYNTDAILEMITMFDKVISQTYFLLENLLEWSRIQRGLIKTKPERTRIKELVDDIIVLLSEKARAKNITLSNTINPEMYAVCDTTMTKTIIRNLVSNALKFTYTGGTVTISSQINNDFAIFTIKDNGQGIHADKISNLFNIMANQTTAGTDNESGTGLGLPLCKEMAEKQGGKIWVISKEGNGSEFHFSINQQAADKSAAI